MSAIHPSTRATRGPSQQCENVTVPATSGYARYSRPSAPIVLLGCRLTPGGANVERVSTGRAVGVVNVSGFGVVCSGVTAVARGGLDDAGAPARGGRPGVNDVDGAHAATTTAAATVSPARRAVRRRVTLVSSGVASGGDNITLNHGDSSAVRAAGSVPSAEIPFWDASG